jgi:hypothetical protein
MPGDTRRRYPPELKARAVRMCAEIRADHESDWEAVGRVAELLGVSTAKTAGCGGVSSRSAGCSLTTVCRSPTTIPDPAAERARDLVGRSFAPAAPDRLWVADGRA